MNQCRNPSELPRRLKLLHVCKNSSLTKGGGGVARHIHGLTSVLPDQVYDIHLLAEEVNSSDLSSGLVEVRFSLLKLFSKIIWADIIHVHGARCFTPALAAILGIFFRKKVVYTPHCYYDGSGLKQQVKHIWDWIIERYLLRRSDAVVLLSEYWRCYLDSRGMHVGNCFIIPNCVCVDFIKFKDRSSVPKLRGQPSILVISRLDPVKRIDTAIRSLRDILLQNAHLHIVGEGECKEFLVELAAELEVEDRIHFYGFATDEVIVEMAAGADVFVLPSSQEGMPTTIIEMLLRGVSVVASDIPGNRSILDRVGYSYMHKLDDERDLARTIILAIEAPVSSSVIAATRTYFTWESQISNLNDIYFS